MHALWEKLAGDRLETEAEEAGAKKLAEESRTTLADIGNILEQVGNSLATSEIQSMQGAGLLDLPVSGSPLVQPPTANRSFDPAGRNGLWLQQVATIR